MAAFFISPSGEIIYVGTTHIAQVISNPEKFDMSFEAIEKIYQQYGERIGLEGKARREILIFLINHGWIRLRRYREYWKVNLNDLNTTNRQYLKKWAKMIMKGDHGFKESDKWIDIVIDQPDKEPLILEAEYLSNQ